MRSDDTVLPQTTEELREQVLGFGESSLRKNYFPLLRQRVEELEFHSAMLDAVRDSVFVHDLAGHLLYANREACEQLEIEPCTQIDEPWVWASQALRDSMIAKIEAIEAAGSLIFRAENDTVKGASTPLEVHASLMSYGGRRVVLAVARDLTDRIESEGRIERLAYYDSLTGLANRALFRDRLNVALARAARSGDSVTLMFLDLDHFKMINDTFGHAHGDEVLQAVAERIEGLVREGDTVARLGGDEFTLLIDGFSREASEHVAQRTLQAFEESFIAVGQELAITASIGVAVATGDSDDTESLMRKADTAMYQAKKAGRASYCVYDPDMDSTRSQFLLLGDLRHAIERSELHLEYQPQIDLHTGEMICAEALLRWNNPAHGPIPPGNFIPVAEKSGYILQLGSWVLREACRQTQEWRSHGLQPVRISVNVSARQAYSKELLDTVREALADFDLPGHMLELEVTETAAMKDSTHVIQQFTALRELGVRIAIDDFGTGHSSLDRLKRFPVNTLKVDGSFLSDVDASGDESAIASSIVVLGRSLGLEVIAEGVETPAQLGFLLQTGCPAAQGYLLCRPITADRLGQLLEPGAVPEWTQVLEECRRG